MITHPVDFSQVAYVARLAMYAPSKKVDLHWHLIEVFYFVISGHATVGDEGRSIHSLPDVTGGHGRQMQESPQLIAITVTESDCAMQVTIDNRTKRS